MRFMLCTFLISGHTIIGGSVAATLIDPHDHNTPELSSLSPVTSTMASHQPATHTLSTPPQTTPPQTTHTQTTHTQTTHTQATHTQTTHQQTTHTQTTHTHTQHTKTKQKNGTASVSTLVNCPAMEIRPLPAKMNIQHLREF